MKDKGTEKYRIRIKSKKKKKKKKKNKKIKKKKFFFQSKCIVNESYVKVIG